MTFAVLFLVVAAGLVGPLLSGTRRLSLPMVAGEIVAGVIIGTTGFQLLDTTDPTLVFLSNLGFGMLLFLVGTKLPLQDPCLGKTCSKGALATALSFAAAIPLAFLLARFSEVGHPGMFVLLLVASSTSTILPILAERKLGGPEICVLGAWIAISDIATIVLLPLATGTGKGWNVALGACLVTTCGVGCYFALRFFRNSSAGSHYRELSKKRGWALDLRLQLLVLFGLAALANVLGTSVMVAGFVAGTISAAIGQPKRFTKQLNGLAEGLFIPLFFVVVGAKVDFRALAGSITHLELAVLIALGAVCVHVLVARVIGLSWASGLVSAQQMGLPASMVTLCLADHLLTPGQAAAIVAAAMLTLISATIGVRLIKPTTGPVCTPTPSTEQSKEADAQGAGSPGSGFGSFPQLDEDTMSGHA